jgi:ElaB/YqjD/DUF883 family membrane-anchored ribosome-binding protein
VVEKFENRDGAAPSTEFERSIARSSAANDASSKASSTTAPLLDGHGNALKREGPNAADDQLQTLKSELENLKQSVAAIASMARGAASEKVDVTVADVEETLKRNVFASVGIAAFIGYLWGRTR